MENPHNTGLTLEILARKVFGNAQRFAFGGIINADVLSRYPFFAALIILARLYNTETKDEIDTFINKYLCAFYYPEDDNAKTRREFCDGLRSLVSKLQHED